MEAFLYVLERSKAPYLLILGSVFAMGVMLYGSHVEAQVSFEGVFAPLTDVFRQLIHDRYDKAAMGILGSSALGAYKIFRRDWKRLLG